jgi:uncharacterized protein YkwD
MGLLDRLSDWLRRWLPRRQPPPPPPDPGPDPLDLAAAVNAFRTSQGLPPLRVNAALRAAAVGHAGWMAAAGRLTHDEPGGGPEERAAVAGYHFAALGEVIAPGADAAAAVRAWANSPPHRAILSSPVYDELGCGVGRSPGADYWCCDVGRAGGPGSARQLVQFGGPLVGA